MFKRDPKTNKFIWNEWSLPEFGYLAANEWDFDEKVDGTNVRVMFDGTSVKFGGRTDNAQMPIPLLNRLQELFGNIDLWQVTFDTDCTDICLYGEGYGAKIQKNGHLYSPTQEFVLFDVNINGIWLEREQVKDIANKLYIQMVPCLGRGSLYEGIDTVEEGVTSAWGEFTAEGIVARPVVRLLDKRGERIITKLKTVDFV